MTALGRVFLGTAAAVLALDTIGAVAAAKTGFPYGSLAVVSYVIYAASGFFSMRYGGFPAAAAGGAFAGLVDATAGWAIAWAIGPGRPPDGYTGMAPILFAVTVVVIIGSILGLAGGLVARLTRKVRTS